MVSQSKGKASLTVTEITRVVGKHIESSEMGQNSGIEWTDHTFNPWMGCSKVSPACKNCYAERDFDHRYGKVKWGPHGNRVLTSISNWNKPLKWNREAGFCKHCGYMVNPEIQACSKCFAPAIRPRVFCASLADVFEDWTRPIVGGDGQQLFFQVDRQWKNVLPANLAKGGSGDYPVTMDDVRRRLFSLIDATPNLDWLLLTKRPENIRRMWPTWPSGFAHDGSDGHGSGSRYLKNVWIGTSVENQEYADTRIPELLKCRDLSPVLFLSCEPLLGPVDLNQSWRIHRGDGWKLNRNQYAAECPTSGIDWVIAGGESGPEARPTCANWFRSLRDQCQAANVPFHFKQWGEFDEHQKRIGKKAAGRLLDGLTHDGFPISTSV